MPDSTIKVPTTLGDKDLVDFFKGWRWLRQPAGNIVVDLRAVEFVAPWAITLFASYILWLAEKREASVKILSDGTTWAGKYLAQCGFFELLGEPITAATLPGSTPGCKLTRIAESRDIPKFTNSVMDVLQISDPDVEGAVQYSLVELLRNVVQHSRSPIGGLAMAQYFPHTGLVEVVVADFGIGVLTSLRPRYPDLDSDLKALKFSLLPHVSGTFEQSVYSTMKDNAGLGLFFVKEIATRASGGLFLGSGAALVNLWGDADGTPRRKYVAATKGGWPGTFAVLQLRKESIAEFEALLRVCRDLAAQARKDPRDVYLDFIDEVPDIQDLKVVKVKDFEEDVERAAEIRDTVIIPALAKGELFVLDFSDVPFATQSFVHALMYKVIREHVAFQSCLSIAGCSASTREAVRAVAAYATLKTSL